MRRQWMKKLIGALIFLAGFLVLFYPTFSDLWNQYRQNRLIGDYEEAARTMTKEDYSSWMEAAKRYNEKLDPSFSDAFRGDDPESDDEYWSLLNLNGDGIMGSLEIPKISLKLPVYHGTGDQALQNGAGHLVGTSLPIGGPGTHSVLSGHRGLPSALLFTDLDQIEEGDLFFISVLGEKLAYQVDQILVVEPDDVSALKVEPGEDHVTLVTCTPYGVNTHRLLVRGTRTDLPEEIPEVTAADQIVQSFGWKGKLAAAVFGLVVLIILVMALIRRKKNSGEDREAE